MNLTGWKNLFRPGREDVASPFAGIVTRVHHVRENCARHVQSNSQVQNTRQRGERVAAARKTIVYNPPEFERKPWTEPVPLYSLWRWMVAGFLLMFVVGAACWLVNAGESRAARRKCVANLRLIEGAMVQWAVQNGKTTNDSPTDAELFGPTTFIPARPVCPEGGVYIFGKVGDPPRCTIPGHTIERFQDIQVTGER